MSIILGLISLIAAIAIPIAATVYFNFEVIHFSMLFIVPVGALAIGVLAGFGYFKGLVIKNSKITGKHYLVALIIGIICLGAVKYGTYRLTCITPEYEIEYTLDGNHVSNYEIDGYGQLTFVNFNKYLIESTPISFSRRSREIGQVDNKTIQWALAIVDYLGVIIGCLAAGIFATGDCEYCDGCNKYMKKKTIFKVKKEDGQAFTSELNALIGEDMPTITLKDLENKYAGKGREHLIASILHCDSCHKTFIELELFENVGSRKYTLNKDFEYKKEISHQLVRDYTDQAS